MKNTQTVIRILLGLMVLLFGLNKFLTFIPMPPPTGQAFRLANRNNYFK